MDPRASTPRDIEAVEVLYCRKSARSQGVPRAVFEACSASAPVVDLFIRVYPLGQHRDCPPCEALGTWTAFL
jgi:hypothetical protein